MSDAQESESLSKELLASIVCPLTQSKLVQEGDELVAAVGGLRYPIRDGIPVMLVDQAALPEGFSDVEALKQAIANESGAGD